MTPLIDEMRAQIHATPMQARRARSRWRPRRRVSGLALASGGALALAAIAAAVMLVITAGPSAPPAYAATFHMTPGGQRTVTITLREWQDLPKLNALLTADNTRIRVVPVASGCVAPVHVVIGAYRGVPAHVAPGPPRTLEVDRIERPFLVTVAVDTLPGRTFIFAVTKSHMLGDLAGPGDGVVVGPAPSCVGIGTRFDLTPG